MMKPKIAFMAVCLIGVSTFVANLYAAERIFSDGFEDDLDQWALVDPSIHYQSSEFAHSSAHSHGVLDIGSLGEIASVNFVAPSSKRIYLSFWWLLEDAPDTGGKLGGFTVPGTGAQMEIWWTNDSHTIAVHHYDTTSTRPECSVGTSRVHYTNTVVFDNNWHHFELFIEYNTPGIDDGRLRIWIDRPAKAAFTDARYLKVNHDDVVFVNEGVCEVYYSNLRLPTNLDARMQPGSLYYDDVEIWDDLPAIPLPRPAAPTGLRIVQ